MKKNEIAPVTLAAQYFWCNFTEFNCQPTMLIT